MDPIADKLLIAAALISLVSADRLAGWVAMVIIAREFAVSALRIAAGAQGVVIPASKLGKIKTIVQVRSEEHTSELQPRQYLVCRLLLEKKIKEALHIRFSVTAMTSL